MKSYFQLLTLLLLLALKVKSKSVEEDDLVSETTQHTVQNRNQQIPANNHDLVPNDIIAVLHRILKRLDVMDSNFSELKKDVASNKKEIAVNQGVLLNIREHLQDQELKIDEVIQKSKVEAKEIDTNRQMVGKVAHQNDEITKLLAKNLKNLTQDVKDVKHVLTDGTSSFKF